MKRHLVAILVVALFGVSVAQAVTTNELVGNWNVAMAGTSQASGLGDVSWKSVAFSTNAVAWVWVRNGKAEEHRGTFVLVPEIPAKAGMFHAYRLDIKPTTPAVPGPLVLKDVRYGEDNRFPSGTFVLKFRDEQGNWHVFQRKKG